MSISFCYLSITLFCLDLFAASNHILKQHVKVTLSSIICKSFLLTFNIDSNVYTRFIALLGVLYRGETITEDYIFNT
jgi:hypothetical protein